MLFSVNGNEAPATVNPLPLTVAALIVTEAVPTELRVIDCVLAEFTEIFPKFTLEGLTVSADVPAPSANAKP